MIILVVCGLSEQRLSERGEIEGQWREVQVDVQGLRGVVLDDGVVASDRSVPDGRCLADVVVRDVRCRGSGRTRGSRQCTDLANVDRPAAHLVRSPRVGRLADLVAFGRVTRGHLADDRVTRRDGKVGAGDHHFIGIYDRLHVRHGDGAVGFHKRDPIFCEKIQR